MACVSAICSYAVKEVNITKLNARERYFLVLHVYLQRDRLNGVCSLLREDAVNEIRILASVVHPNIIRYCDAFTEKDNLYIVMEFAERGDVYHKIKKYRDANRCIREEVIWSYFIQMCRGLRELHSRRIIHRVCCVVLDVEAPAVLLTPLTQFHGGDYACVCAPVRCRISSRRTCS
jgi:serine/threonine protein kinase